MVADFDQETNKVISPSKLAHTENHHEKRQSPHASTSFTVLGNLSYLRQSSEVEGMCSSYRDQNQKSWICHPVKKLAQSDRLLYLSESNAIGSIEKLFRRLTSLLGVSSTLLCPCSALGFRANGSSTKPWSSACLWRKSAPLVVCTTGKFCCVTAVRAKDAISLAKGMLCSVASSTREKWVAPMSMRTRSDGTVRSFCRAKM